MLFAGVRRTEAMISAYPGGMRPPPAGDAASPPPPAGVSLGAAGPGGDDAEAGSSGDAGSAGTVVEVVVVVVVEEVPGNSGTWATADQPVASPAVTATTKRIGLRDIAVRSAFADRPAISCRNQCIHSPARSRRTRSSVGGCVMKRFLNCTSRPVSGFTM